MIRSTKYALVFCLAGVAAAVGPVRAADALPCAEYISSSIDSEPGVGHLIGSETRTETITYTIEASPGGVGSSTTVTKSWTYEVGIYEMNGVRFRMDCRDYTPDN